MSEEFKDLSQLGRPTTGPSKNLEAFPNRTPDRFYLVTLYTDEFTCFCPITKQPDFAKIKISYIPDQKIVESKSLKLYFWSFRDEGIFHEYLVNKILQDLVDILDPHYIHVEGTFNIRGGIGIKVDSKHIKTEEALAIL